MKAKHQGSRKVVVAKRRKRKAKGITTMLTRVLLLLRMLNTLVTHPQPVVPVASHKFKATVTVTVTVMG